jgi:hypothetical protein
LSVCTLCHCVIYLVVMLAYMLAMVELTGVNFKIMITYEFHCVLETLGLFKILVGFHYIPWLNLFQSVVSQ